MAAAAACPAASAEEADELQRLGERLRSELAAIFDRNEVEPLERPPAWAVEVDREPPVLTFVQLADAHWGARYTGELDAAVDFIEGSLRPDLVVLTGDNIARPSHFGRQLELRALLERRLRRPFLAVEGDNDTRGFARAFGPTDWSAAFAGLHLVGLGLDCDSEGDGIGTLNEDTFLWLRSRLAAHAGQSALIFIHEPVFPPSFASAPSLLVFLGGYPEVAAVISGHVHRDLSFATPGLTHVIAPALGPSPRHGLKEYRVFADRIVVRTYERPDGGDGYRFASKWQRIRLRFPAGPRPAGAFALEEFAPRDGHETYLSPEWARTREQLFDVARFLFRHLGRARDRHLRRP